MSEEQAETKWFKHFLTLFLVGFLVILFGVVLLTVAALLSGAGNANVGGVIFIWFFPIVFGVGPETHWLISIAVILAVLSIIIFLVTRKTLGKGEF